MRKRNLIYVGISIICFFALSPFLMDHLYSESEIILAKVGEEFVTQKDFDEVLNNYKVTKKEKSFTGEEKKAILENLVMSFLFSEEARKEKMDQKPEVKSKLKLAHINVLSQEYIKHKISPFVQVTDKEIEEKFKENPNLLPKEFITLREILVNTEEEAQGIYEEVKKGGNFSKIASEKSLAPSKTNGGLRRGISKGQLPKNLEEVAFNLKKGEVSKPIKTENGFYLFYLEDKKELTEMELKRYEEIIKEKIKKIEIAKKTQDMVVNKAKELMKERPIEVYYDRIK